MIETADAIQGRRLTVNLLAGREVTDVESAGKGELIIRASDCHSRTGRVAFGPRVY
jgi:hypothetical protein